MDDRPPRDLDDPDYGVADFQHDVAGGGLRWLTTILALLSAGALAASLTGWWQFEVHWPFHIHGTAATIAIIASIVVWSLLAVVNWFAWLRSRSDGA